MKYLSVAGAALIALYTLFSIVQSIIFPIIAPLLGGADALITVSQALSYTYVITALAYALFAVGAFAQRRLPAIIAASGAAVVVISLVISIMASSAGVVPGYIPVPLLILQVIKALAVVLYAIALALCLSGGWRAYGFITVAAVTMSAIVNGAATAWAFMSTDNIGQRLAVMGTVSRLTGWADAMLTLILSAAFIYCAIKNTTGPVRTRDSVA